MKNKRHFKCLFNLLLVSAISACSSSPTHSQASIDTRACNTISYGNKNVDTQSMDDIFNKCMSDKTKIRDQQKEEADNRAIFEFFLALFRSFGS